MVRVGAPLMSLTGIGPLRKKRTVYGPAPAVPAVEHVLVTAGDPAPDPNCTGIYNRISDFNGHACYQKTTEPFFYLFYSGFLTFWNISLTLESFPDNEFLNPINQIGEFEAAGETYTGTAIASAPIP